MPPALVVRARVIDASTDAPRDSDRFVIDTNVWAWEYYPNSHYTAAGGLLPRATAYSPFLQRARDNGSSLLRVTTSLAEMASVVERTEHAFYAAGVAPLSLKDYRHDLPAERARVTTEVRRAWGLVEADSSPLPLAMDALADAVLDLLAAYPLDGYDAVLVAAALAAGLAQVVSDDGDLCCVAGLEVFTANPRALAAARAQGRLASR